jgi:hypothetical protein
MVSHLTAVITAASCVGLPWFFGLFSHASPEAQVISLLERQLQRCGPENQTCPPCLAHDYCSWTTVTAAGLVGFVGGLLAAAAGGSIFLLCRFRQQSYEPRVISPGSGGKTLPTSELQYNTSDLVSSPTDSRASSKSSNSAQRRKVRPAVPLAILSADQIRDL